MGVLCPRWGLVLLMGLVVTWAEKLVGVNNNNDIYIYKQFNNMTNIYIYMFVILLIFFTINCNYHEINILQYLNAMILSNLTNMCR